jgi:metal-sulfur cluster biosynthetic enzyme
MPSSAEAVRAALRQVIDPEVGINIMDLGLVYGIALDGDRVTIAVTMTSPACPLADYLKDEIARTVQERAPGVGHVTVALVWDPPWTSERISAAARRQLGWPDAEPPSPGDTTSG